MIDALRLFPDTTFPSTIPVFWLRMVRQRTRKVNGGNGMEAMSSAGDGGLAVSPVRRKIPAPGKYGSFRDVVRLKRVPKKNTNVVLKKSVSVAVDPFISSDESDTEESSGAVYTRLGLIANMSLKSCTTGDGKGATPSTGVRRDAGRSVVKKKVPVTMFFPRKYGPIGDVVRSKQVPKGNRVPKKNTKIARKSVFVGAVDPIVSSAKSDSEESAAVVPTRSELIHRFWRAMLLPSEQCRQAIGWNPGIGSAYAEQPSPFGC